MHRFALVGPFGHSPDDIVYQWRSDSPIEVKSQQPVNDFNFMEVRGQIYSPLSVKFVFERQFSPYWLRVYIPCIFFVCLAYLFLWIRREEYRFMLSLIVTITLACLIAFVSDNFPNTSYIKSVDIWTGTCLTFATASLLLVIVLSQMPQESGKRRQSLEDGKDDPFVGKQAPDTGPRWIKKITRTLVQKAARIGYPVLFLLFSLVYWITQGRTHLP